MNESRKNFSKPEGYESPEARQMRWDAMDAETKRLIEACSDRLDFAEKGMALMSYSERKALDSMSYSESIHACCQKAERASIKTEH